MQVVYVCADNPVSISIPGISNDKLVVKAENAELTGDSGHYIIRPVDNIQARFVKLIVASRTNNGISKPDTVKLRIKRFPIGKIFLGVKGEGTISRTELLIQSLVSVTIENNPFAGLKSDVKSFTLRLFGPERYIRHFNHGALLDAVSKGILSQARKNEMIAIEDVTAETPSITCPSSVPPARFWIEPDEGMPCGREAFSETDSPDIVLYYAEEGIMIDTPALSKHTVSVRSLQGNTILLSEEYFNKARLRSKKDYYIIGRPAMDREYFPIPSVKIYDSSGRLSASAAFKKTDGPRMFNNDTVSAFMDGFYPGIFDPVKGAAEPNSGFSRYNLYFPFRMTGSWKYYSPDGKIRSEGQYVPLERKNTGPVISISCGNTPAEKYPLGLRNGLWRFYSENGKLAKEITYKESKVIKRKVYNQRRK